MVNGPLSIRRLVMAFAAVCLLAGVSRSQAPAAGEPLQLLSCTPVEVRSSISESWSTLRVEVANWADQPRVARVAVFYPQQPDVQFARDLIIPGRSSTFSWLTLGPAPAQTWAMARDLELRLVDRTGGQDRLVLAPDSERVRHLRFLYRPREASTAVLLDNVSGESSAPDQSAEPEALLLARSARAGASLSEAVSVVRERMLPPVPEAYDGIDVLVLAGNEIGADPVGRQGIRRWVQEGGTLWVLLDHVSSKTLAPLLGEDLEFREIDRVPLTTLRLCRAGDDPAEAEARVLEYPVSLVRVALGSLDSPLYTVNGWPAAFNRPIGRGRVIFTTLGARGWYHPRGPRDGQSPFPHFPDQPVPVNQLADFSVRYLHPKESSAAPIPDIFREMAIREVGYSVIGRGPAALLLGGFAAVLIAIGLGFRRSRLALVWLPPVLALLTSAAFIAMGIASRHTAPPTLALAAVVEAAAGTGEAAATGAIAVYRPDSGPVELTAQPGARLSLDEGGLAGQVRQRVVTGLGDWHWEGLSLPAGLRTGAFRAIFPGCRLGAAGRFNADGLDGRFSFAPFREPSDGLILTASREIMPVSFNPSGDFTTRGQAPLPPGEFLTNTVLTDRQQQRQAVYRRLLRESFPKHWEGKDLLLAWADTTELPFAVEAGERRSGIALLAAPLEFEHPPPGTAVRVPRVFIKPYRVHLGRQRPLVMDGHGGIEMDLRFQLPASVLPMTIDRATLTARVRAPGRMVTILGPGPDGPLKLLEVEGPIDPIRIDLSDPRQLMLDSEGGLRLTLRIGEQPGTGTAKRPEAGKVSAPPKGFGPKGAKGEEVLPAKAKEQWPDLIWKIETLGLDVTGRTGER